MSMTGRAEADDDLIDSFSQYRDAVLALIDRTGHTLEICDPDLSQLPLECPTGVAALEAFLLRSALPDCLRIVVHDVTHLEKYCPRLLRLLTNHAHRVKVRVSAREHRKLEQCFIVADKTHRLIRFHRDLPRARLGLNVPTDAAESLLQFNALWERAQAVSPGRRLGL
jgi:hypothetical protein